MTSVIILAAGRGTRMQGLASDRPKCFLELNGQSLLEHQVRNLRSAGLTDITVVTGHGAKHFAPFDLSTHFHSEFAETNMVSSMFSASSCFEHANKPVLVHYGDVIIEPRHLRALSTCGHDVACMLDDDWIPYFMSRGSHWREDVEELLMGPDDRIRYFGGASTELDRAHARFVGAMRFSAAAAPQAMVRYRELERETSSQHERAFDARQLDSTQFLQILIDGGQAVHGLRIRGGWLELDCEADYRLAREWVASGTMPFMDGVAALQLPPK